MPPKKVEEEKRPPIFGRLGSNLKMGILGLPNVGKSTFFNVLTKSSAQAENFPFCTVSFLTKAGFYFPTFPRLIQMKVGLPFKMNASIGFVNTINH